MARRSSSRSRGRPCIRVHLSDLVQFWLASDAVNPTFRWLAPIMDEVPEDERDAIMHLGYTIGGKFSVESTKRPGDGARLNPCHTGSGTRRNGTACRPNSSTTVLACTSSIRRSPATGRRFTTSGSLWVALVAPLSTWLT